MILVTLVSAPASYYFEFHNRKAIFLAVLA